MSDQLVDCFRVPVVTVPDTDLHFANFRSPGNEVPVGIIIIIIIIIMLILSLYTRKLTRLSC